MNSQYKQCCLQIAILFLLAQCTIAFYEWSHQQTLFVPHARRTYGRTTPLLVGRGFQTLITGYDPISPGIFVHTTDDGYVEHGHVVWSQQKVLKPSDDLLPSDMFGKTMVCFNQTLIVAAPHRSSNRGVVYVFNGTKRHWFQVQRLSSAESSADDLFGDSMALHKNRLIIGAKGMTAGGGAAYVYERPAGGLYWSRTAKLIPRDQRDGGTFADRVSLYEGTVAVSAHNDNPGDSILSGDEFNYGTGSAYIFTGSAGTWSQQQKLVAADFLMYEKGGASREFLDVTLGSRILGPEIAVNKDSVAMGVINVNGSLPNRESLYIFQGSASTNSWSLQQKLLAKNDSTPDPYYRSSVVMDAHDMLIGTVAGREITSSYVFKSFGKGWSLQQRLNAFNLTGVDLDDNSTYPAELKELTFPANFTADEKKRELTTRFSNPGLWGGHMIHNAGPIGGVQIRSQYRNGSCLLLWLSDHYLDGWDTAVLTVRAPDLTNDTFHPHCDQVDPFLVRYCPYQPSEEGVYIVKVFDAVKARFFWEMSWQVTIEATGETFKGDFSTKMEFRYDGYSSTFSLVSIQNEIDLEADCFRCTRFSALSWTQLQIPGNSAFWPLVVSGAPYYISSYDGRTLAATGKVCDGVTKYECYQTMADGIYTLRLGGGSFGRLTGFPHNESYWKGCGVEGGLHDQLVFRIIGGECKPLQVHHYHGRCDLPPPVTATAYLDSGGATTASPSYGGTVKPTQNVFGTGAAGGKNSYIRRQRGATFEADSTYDDDTVAAPEGSIGERSADDDQQQDGAGTGGGDGSDDAENVGEAETEKAGQGAPLDAFELLGELLKSKRPALVSAKPSSADSSDSHQLDTGADINNHVIEEETAHKIGDLDSAQSYRAATKTTLL